MAAAAWAVAEWAAAAPAAAATAVVERVAATAAVATVAATTAAAAMAAAATAAVVTEEAVRVVARVAARVAARGAVARVEAEMEAAARAVVHLAVAVVLGGCQEAHWEGRRAAAERAAEVMGVATPGRLRGPQKGAAQLVGGACQRFRPPFPSSPVATARHLPPPLPQRLLRSGSLPPRARLLT